MTSSTPDKGKVPNPQTEFDSDEEDIFHDARFPAEEETVSPPHLPMERTSRTQTNARTP
jgi:hypothetical protein